MVHGVLAFIEMPSWQWLVIALFGMILFGKRLPDVGKSLGQSIVEFKKGLRGVDEDVHKAVQSDAADPLLPTPDLNKPSESKS